jgi:hypothetical protein
MKEATRAQLGDGGGRSRRRRRRRFITISKKACHWSLS